MQLQRKYTTSIVWDREESIRCDQDVLGFAEDSQYRPHPDTTITLMRAPKGETMVELIRSDAFETGFYSIGMEVEDMDEAMATLKARGAKILAEPAPTLVGSCAFIQDVNGVNIALVHHA